jgi:hypothetical protein
MLSTWQLIFANPRSRIGMSKCFSQISWKIRKNGYDNSEYAGEWSAARKVMAASELVRLGQSEGGLDLQRLPPTVGKWLSSGKYKSSELARLLAVQACQRLVQSEWLKDDCFEMWNETLKRLLKELGCHEFSG